MATKKYPHEQYLEDGKDLFATKDLPSELQTQIKVWNMHKNKRDEKENGILSLNIANNMEVWMKEKGFLDEVQDDEPKATPSTPVPTKTEAEIAAEVEAKLRAEAEEKVKADKAATDAAAAQKAADDAAATQKAADDAAAAQKAADDAAVAQKAADDKAAADAVAAVEAKKKADPHYGMTYYPIVGWLHDKKKA